MGIVLETRALVVKRKRTPNQNPESKVIYLFQFHQFLRDKEIEIEDADRDPSPTGQLRRRRRRRRSFTYLPDTLAETGETFNHSQRTSLAHSFEVSSDFNTIPKLCI
ncbi:hypothetical protein PanWU01x14_177770 [Parasponia andersonii]|uniref:Uncharacterized protein n=1 Tax=Parasponia andersonii TaxID=3476 RepID=A0A2P5C7C9_PARAD|nr:hypothetical protein PanWU01x14_177770 [Parasponia andersonii]